jgi:hypothetical protein
MNNFMNELSQISNYINAKLPIFNSLATPLCNFDTETSMLRYTQAPMLGIMKRSNTGDWVKLEEAIEIVDATNAELTKAKVELADTKLMKQAAYVEVSNLKHDLQTINQYANRLLVTCYLMMAGLASLTASIIYLYQLYLASNL